MHIGNCTVVKKRCAITVPISPSVPILELRCVETAIANVAVFNRMGGPKCKGGNVRNWSGSCHEMCPPMPFRLSQRNNPSSVDAFVGIDFKWNKISYNSKYNKYNIQPFSISWRKWEDLAEKWFLSLKISSGTLWPVVKYDNGRRLRKEKLNMAPKFNPSSSLVNKTRLIPKEENCL